MRKTCKLCDASYEVSKDDLQLLEKLSPEIAGVKHALPPPTHCPRCRQRRRMSFRNERHLYRRKCDVTGKEIISVFSPENPHKVCEKTHWYSDAFDPLVYGRPYDFSRPFFEQFADLVRDTPLPSLRVELSENCDFNVDMSSCRDCYMCSRTHLSQSMLYTYRGNKSSDCVDCMQVTQCAFLYECVECLKCIDSRYLFFCMECSSSAFLLDCRNCMDCFMCYNLRNKRHCFLNEQLTKEQYEKKLKEFDFGSSKMVQVAQKMYRDIRRKAIRRALAISNCENVTGDNLVGCKNCHACFGAQDCRDCRYLWDVKLHRDAMDEYSGGRDSELMYDTTSGSGCYDVQFCLRASNSQHIRYSFYVTASKNIFGCIGIRRKEYCILNKEYTKEEYEELLPRIIEHMRGTGQWGEFFPASLSPFAYNETVAQEYFPLKQQEANELGYRWQKPEARVPAKGAYAIPSKIDEVAQDIVSQALRCETCGRGYKVVPQELAFYKDRHIPVPRSCADCRTLVRFQSKNPPLLRQTTCRKCGKEIATSFPEDCPEIIYCEKCYLATVY